MVRRMLLARLRRNLARLKPVFHRTDTTAFRLYDRDIPERPWTIDVYEKRVLATEWVTPVALKRGEAARRAERNEAENAIASVLKLSPEAIRWRTRQRHRSVEREAEGSRRHEFEVREHGLRFLVNLDDYLDTGLFLDHRPARVRVAKEAAGKRLLNLFCYTGAFSVHAAGAGAVGTQSVDLSPTYCGWAERNLALNGFSSPDHAVVRADVFDYLKNGRDTFDVIVIDPPTVSRSARGRSFEIQRVHRELIGLGLERLERGGLLFFSTNDRRFEMDPRAARGEPCREVTNETTPLDFRSPAHRAWEIRKR